MGINVGGIIPIIIFGCGAVVLGLSYLAVYFMGRTRRGRSSAASVCSVSVSSRTGWIASRLPSSQSRSGWSGSGRGSGTC